MKANELMIGDIITFKDSLQTDETPIPVKVVALGYQHRGEENEALVQIGNDNTCDIVTIDEEFVGYPLTAEILEKNFPDPEIVCWYPDNNTYRIIIGDDVALNIKYIHELQHALRLCGIEKEIVL
jgi:hypothetical protein